MMRGMFLFLVVVMAYVCVNIIIIFIINGLHVFREIATAMKKESALYTCVLLLFVLLVEVRH